VSEPLVSFVVLCYHTEPFVAECIRSILAQKSAVPFEIIAVDDCSPDGTLEVLRQFKDPRLRIIAHPKNCGHAQTVEDGMHAARGRYIARIDSDDRYRPDFLDRVVPILEQHPEVGLVYGDAALIDQRGVQNAPRCDRQHHGSDFKGNELTALLEENFVCAPTVIARREDWLECLPVPRHLAFHDWYFTVKIARRHQFYFVNETLADYRVHSGNMHSHIVLNRTEEPSIFWMLDMVYASPESDPKLEADKRAARRRVYGRHFWTLANKYFGAAMYTDARRCYLRAGWYKPGYLLRFDCQRRLLATFVGSEFYERCKGWARTWLLRPGWKRT
jgi:glycosyltransferase involved in cell wall biosynthesis